MAGRTAAGDGPLAARLGAPSVQESGTARKYSNSPGRGGLAGTREDGDLHGRTRVDVLPCACKRSAVRARLAPLVRSEIRTNRTASTAAKYSNGGRLGRRTCIRTGVLIAARAAGRTADTRWRSVTRPVSWANSISLGAVTLAVCSRPGSCRRPRLTVTVAVFADGRRVEARAPALLRAAAAAGTAACSLVRRGPGCAGSVRYVSRRGGCAVARSGASAAAPLRRVRTRAARRMKFDGRGHQASWERADLADAGPPRRGAEPSEGSACWRLKSGP